MDDLISVIVPVYNSKDTICGCLDSLLAQTKMNLEFLCVDACSTDGTGDILERYAWLDGRIRIIRSEKKSYGYQVNLGIREALGKYIGIVEADDATSPDMYEVLGDAALENEPDFVRADYYETYYRYGITGRDTKRDNARLDKRIVRIVKDKSRYGKTFSLKEDPVCIHPDAIATWSGIYRRDFLAKYGIMHNETPGASFQDMGFWAQVHYYADKVMFINCPLYRYRIDNPVSSTFQRGKEYCLSDELRFTVKKIADSDHSGKDNILDRLAWVFYRKYKRNIERVPTCGLEKYYCRFSDDFRLWEGYFGLRYSCFYDEEAKELKAILKDSSDFIKRLSFEKDAFIEELRKCKAIAIYGAGLIGRTIASYLNGNIVCYATSERSETNSVNDIPIKDIHELAHNADGLTIVIASKRSDYRAEMQRLAEELGFSSIKMAPYGAFEQ